MVNLMALEGAAEREFEKQADIWAGVIAGREGLHPEDLRPHIARLSYKKGHWLDITFLIPEHAPIRLSAGFGCTKMVEFEDGKLIGDYNWYVFRTNHMGSIGFRGVRDLGQALLLARWEYEGDERAKWA